MLAVTLPRYLKDHFQLDRGAERKACDSIHQATRTLVLSEDVCSNSEAASATFGCSRKSPEVATETNDALDPLEHPKCCRATARALSV